MARNIETRTLQQVTAKTRAADPHAREDYEPVFDRDSFERRVLAFVTDEEDATASPIGAVPRNSIPAVAHAMRRDHPDLGEQDVEAALAKLVDGGLVEQRDDGTYGLTEDGFVERKN
jgi:hypothetical protein